MGTFLVEKNNESTLLLFNKRIVYKNDAKNSVSSEYENLMDFTAEKYLYGRVNRRFTPIYVTSTFGNNLKQFKSTNAQQNGVRALNFVVDAFNDMLQQFQKCAMTGKIATDDPYLSTLKVYKAYQDPQVLYNNYKQRYRGLIKQIADSQENKIENFDQFTNLMQQRASSKGKQEPITFPAFVKSRVCPLTVSGLVIEIADLDATNDQQKSDVFLNSKNWQFFVNAAKTYGFMIDQHVPWRLVADIGSSTMIQYARRYGATSTDGILARYYRPAYSPYANNFSSELLDVYNTVKPTNIQYFEECNGRTIARNKKPKTYSNVQRLTEQYESSYFLQFYCRTRFYEEESNFTENQKALMIDDVVEISQRVNTTTALRQFELILNKTFDYQGSLSYYINKEKAIKDSER